ncbi:MAG: hypothetical protein C0616_03350 [Desulfuromonas sp.]|nr:MAG: hypothetical protein C0616_03350 [Desulfuromonas sp.]
MRLRSRCGDQQGAAVVEFAVLFLLLIIFLFGIFELGFVWVQSFYVANAAREGARVAAKLDPEEVPDPTNNVQSAVKSYLGGLYTSDRTDDCCASGDFIGVVINNAKTLSAGTTTVPAIEVTVTVQTADIYEPILWDLLNLIPGTDVTEVRQISGSAVFARDP